jgi:hypothetical protein
MCTSSWESGTPLFDGTKDLQAGISALTRFKHAEGLLSCTACSIFSALPRMVSAHAVQTHGIYGVGDPDAIAWPLRITPLRAWGCVCFRSGWFLAPSGVLLALFSNLCSSFACRVYIFGSSVA